jgi:hypothetical protein
MEASRRSYEQTRVQAMADRHKRWVSVSPNAQTAVKVASKLENAHKVPENGNWLREMTYEEPAFGRMSELWRQLWCSL